MFKNYYRQIGLTKENSLLINETLKEKDLLFLATKLIEYLTLVILNNTINRFCKTNIIDIKSIAIEHPKTSLKLSKTIKQDKKVFQVGTDKNSNSPLYQEIAKRAKCLDEKKCKKCNNFMFP